MFTGIIEYCGKIAKLELTPSRCVIWIEHEFTDLVVGESIAVDGICLTATHFTESQVRFDVSPETRQVTRAEEWQVGERVNLERALRLNDRLGGHFVTGHVDCTARLAVRKELKDYLQFVIEALPKSAFRYLVPKGSVAMNGVSLTINEVTSKGFTVMLIPHTLEKTNLIDLQINQKVNIEYDYLARLLEKQSSLK